MSNSNPTNRVLFTNHG